MNDERTDRMRYRLEKYGKGILSKETIERMCMGLGRKPESTEEMYLCMPIYPAKPRQTDKDGMKIPKRQVKKALAEVREELGYPDFRHKMWKGIC